MANRLSRPRSDFFRNFSAHVKSRSDSEVNRPNAELNCRPALAKDLEANCGPCQTKHHESDHPNADLSRPCRWALIHLAFQIVPLAPLTENYFIKLRNFDYHDSEHYIKQSHTIELKERVSLLDILGRWSASVMRREKCRYSSWETNSTGYRHCGFEAQVGVRTGGSRGVNWGCSIPRSFLGKDWGTRARITHALKQVPHPSPLPGRERELLVSFALLTVLGKPYGTRNPNGSTEFRKFPFPNTVPF